MHDSIGELFLFRIKHAKCYDCKCFSSFFADKVNLTAACDETASLRTSLADTEVEFTAARDETASFTISLADKEVELTSSKDETASLRTSLADKVV